MSTALSWTEFRRGREDLGSLLRFRGSGLPDSGRRRVWLGGLLVLLLTAAAVLGPAYLGGEAPRDRSGQLLAVLPSLCLGFLVLASFTAVASAGGREIVPRDQAVAFPVSTVTEHLGALLLAPLNIAWSRRPGLCSASPPTHSARSGSGPTSCRSCSGSSRRRQRRRWSAGSAKGYAGACTGSSSSAAPSACSLSPPPSSW